LTEPVSFPAFGSTAVVLSTERSADAVAAVQRTVAEFDLACSRFREDSELSRLNRAGGRPVRAGALLREAVSAAVRAAELSGGDVDPTLGGALIALGYDRDFDLGLNGRGAGVKPGSFAPPAPQRSLSFASIPGWRTIRVDDRSGTIDLAPNVTLDLGATAKALACDHAAAAARAAAGCGVLVSLGGDIAIAGPAPAGGWRVRVTDDHRAGAEAPGQWITLQSGGLATSSTTVRRWNSEGETVHHLLDPAGGRPVGAGWRTASVAAGSCLDANIASTAAIVRGAPASEWLAELGLPARLVSAAGAAVHLAGWPVEGEELPSPEALDAARTRAPA